MNGVAVPAGELLPQGFFGTTPGAEAEKYDPEGAKKLLAEAGYPDGFGLTLGSPNDRYINDAQVRSEEHTSELQSLMRISYAVFCLKKHNHKTEASLHHK